MADPMLRGSSSGIRSAPIKPQFGQGLPPRQPTAVPGTFAGGLTQDYYGPKVTPQSIAASNAAEVARISAGYPQASMSAPIAPLAPPSGGGDVSGGVSGAAMQGLQAAGGMGIEDPMSSLSMPAGLREGLGRRQYHTLANALAGLRY